MRSVLLILMFLLMTGTLIACTPNNPPQDQPFRVTESYNKGGIPAPYGNPESILLMEKKIKRLSGVQDARIITYGDTIIVGLDTNYRRKHVKKQVFQALEREARSYILYISVNDSNTMRRIADIRQKIFNGTWDADAEGDARKLIADLGTTMTPSTTE